jgi:hypothetical protein
MHEGNGDKVPIYSSHYNSDVCRWAAKNLLINGMGCYACLYSMGLNYGGKAIWVIDCMNRTK